VNHPAVSETAALVEAGFGLEQLARLAALLSPAPAFRLSDSPELAALAQHLPGADIAFNQDRLHGYAKLVREFYWDNRLGQFLRESLPHYQQALRQAPASRAPVGTRILISLLAPLAPEGRLQFERHAPRPVRYLILAPWNRR